jgi:hypothetical protein
MRFDNPLSIQASDLETCDIAVEQSGSSIVASYSSNSEDRQRVTPAALAASLRKEIGFLSTSSIEPHCSVQPEAFDLGERQRKTGKPSDQFRGPACCCRAEAKKEPQKHG